MTAKAPERRDGPRIDLRLRVRYSDENLGTGEAEASDVSPKGLRLESEKSVPVGSALKLHVDAGEAEELETTGHVTWCRPRPSPTGKTMYDVGLRFESDWLTKDRGPLGSALARIFAMNSYEPARADERTPVALRATTAGTPPLALEVGNLSLGGMQLRAPEGLNERVKSGEMLMVEIELATRRTTLKGRVAWVAGDRGPRAPGTLRVTDSFGIQFEGMTDEDRALIDRIRIGTENPKRVTITITS